MDPGKGHEEKVSRIIGSIRFMEGGLPKAQWRKTVYIGSKRLTMPVPDALEALIFDRQAADHRFRRPERKRFQDGRIADGGIRINANKT